MTEYTYTVVLLPDLQGGFTVTVPAFPECTAQGDTKGDALVNAQEAIELHIQNYLSQQIPIPADIAKAPIIEQVQIKLP